VKARDVATSAVARVGDEATLVVEWIDAYRVWLDVTITRDESQVQIGVRDPDFSDSRIFWLRGGD
jgi:hypothetical protein